jgi:uncharacterized protein
LNILLTGSSGLIGTALTDRLLADDHSVARLVRGAPEQGSGTFDISWDPDRGAIDLSSLEQGGPYDGVVHLAGAGIGEKRWSVERKRIVLRSRTESTRLLADALCQLSARPPVLVSASAVGFYGDRGDEELTESSTAGTGFLAELCQAWEGAAESATGCGIRTVHLRTGIVISATGGALEKQLPLFRLGLGGRMGTGRQYRSWIALEDEVGVILCCLSDDTLRGPVNATAPDPVTDGALAKALGSVLHRPALVAVPATALRLVLGREMADELVLSGQRVLPAAVLARGYRFAHTDLDHALRSVLTPAR